MSKSSLISTTVIAGLAAAVIFSTYNMSRASASGQEPETTARSSHKSVYDGKTLFEGIFFGSGPASSVLPDRTSGLDLTVSPLTLNPSQSGLSIAAATRRRDAMLVTLSNKDSTFFDRFGEGMNSGNRVRIDALLREAVNNINEQEALLQQNTRPSVEPICGDQLICPIPTQYRILIVGNHEKVVNSALYRELIVDKIASVLT